MAGHVIRNRAVVLRRMHHRPEPVDQAPRSARPVRRDSRWYG